MSDSTFTIGCEVECSDGVCGDLRRVIVDPIARALTHLVVEPKHRLGMAKLVPIDLVDSTKEKEAVQLRCTMSEFEALDDAEETHFLTGASEDWGYGQQQMLSWPYYGLGGMGGMSGGGIGIGGLGAGPQTTTEDSVPVGEVEVRRGDQVQAADGAIGRVQGLVVDPRNRHVTHILLDEGHLWGRKRVAIPISVVTDVRAGVQLKLTKQEVGDLPPIEIDAG